MATKLFLLTFCISKFLCYHSYIHITKHRVVSVYGQDPQPRHLIIPAQRGLGGLHLSCNYSAPALAGPAPALASHKLQLLEPIPALPETQDTATSEN